MSELKSIYMDYGSAMPVDERVVEVMKKYLAEDFGNPSSLHSHGRESKRVIEESREKVAQLIGVKEKKGVIFTSSATESNNLAIRGVAFRNRSKGDHVITSAIEHMSVLNPCKELQKNGFKVSFIQVDKEGIVDIEALKNEITDKTVLISIMYANNEVGTIEPIREIAEIAKDKGIYFHTDAVAALGKIPIDVEKENIDLLTLSSNDIYGPKGVGAVYIDPKVKVQPVILGGGQERGLRSGSESVYGIAGMGKAAEIAKAEMEEESNRLISLRDELIDGVLDKVEKAYLTGHRTIRLPHHASFIFSYIEGESIILNLDMLGLQASTGSACSSKTLEPSHVLLALGLKHEEAHGSLTLTIGRWSTEDDIKHALDVIPPTVERFRAMSPLYEKKNH